MIVDIDTSTEKINLPWGRSSGKDRIVQNIVNILNTYKYEVAYNRNLGISPDILDTDVETMKGIIIENLYDNIAKYEPRARLISVNIKEVTADGHISAAVQIEV